MFLRFNEESQKLFILSLKEKNMLNDLYIGTEHIFLAILSMNNNYICKLLNDYGIYYDNFLAFFNKKKNDKTSNDFLFTPLMKDIISNLSGVDKKEVVINDIIYEILSHSNSKVNLVLKSMNVNVKDIVRKLNINSKKKKSNNKMILNEIGLNLNDKCSNDNELLLGRDNELDNIIEILCCKNKNNPLLIGDAGVGKTAIVEELARRIEKGNVPYQLKNKKIFSLSMSSLVAGTKYRGEFEEKINKLIAEVENCDDIILFIDEIHTLVGAGGADGAIDASNILKPSLARGTVKIIGATTNEEYKKYFSDDKALSRRFKNIYIKEPNCEETKDILKGIKSLYEDFHNVFIPDDIIDKIIFYSDKYISNRKFPDKAIDILDEICVLSSFSFNHIFDKVNVLEKELDNIVTLKNKSLIMSDYKMAKKYSYDESSIKLQILNLKKNYYKKNKRNIVKEEFLLRVMERKTNIPFYSFKYNNKKYIELVKKYKKDSLFDNNIISLIKRYYINFYNNILNNYFGNCLYIESSSDNLNNFFIDEMIHKFFLDKNKIYIDLNNYRSIDDLLRDSNFLSNIKNNIFSIIIVKNFNECVGSIKEFFNDIINNGYYLDNNNDKYELRSNIFIFSSLRCSSSLGFNNSFKNNNNLINLNSISKTKLKNKISNLSEGIYLSSKDLTTICDNITNGSYAFDNIDFLIKKEIYKFRNNLNKNRTIMV